MTRNHNLKLIILLAFAILIICVQTIYLRNKLNRLDSQIKSNSTRNINTNELINLNDFKYKSNKNLEKLPIIAHAGGSYLNNTYTNSLEALEKNKDFYDYFEIDFSKTKDGHYVCSHGWSPRERSLTIGEDIEGPPTIKHFLEKRKLHLWTACTAEEAINWAYANKKKIVTDIKESNVEVLSYLVKNFPLAKIVLIPQIYSIDEYQPVKKIGFDKIIFTLYQTHISEKELLNWLKKTDTSNLYAITTWHHRSPYLTKAVNDHDIPVYVHTVNDINIYNFLAENYGVQGIYTDYISHY